MKEVENRRRRKGMERVYSEGKRKGRIRCGRKDEEEGEGEGKEEEKENRKWRRRYMKGTALSKKYSLARSWGIT